MSCLRTSIVLYWKLYNHSRSKIVNANCFICLRAVRLLSVYFHLHLLQKKPWTLFVSTRLVQKYNNFLIHVLQWQRFRLKCVSWVWEGEKNHHIFGKDIPCFTLQPSLAWIDFPSTQLIQNFSTMRFVQNFSGSLSILVFPRKWRQKSLPTTALLSSFFPTHVRVWLYETRTQLQPPSCIIKHPYPLW